MDGWSELEVHAATNGDFVVSATNGCPNDTQGNAGCPRICQGDYAEPLRISVGVEDDDDLILPANTQRCNTDGPRVNPPGPPESDICNEGGIAGCTMVDHKQVILPPVNLSGITSNSNGRLGLLNQTGGDTTSGTGTVNWNPTSRVLTIDGPPQSDPLFNDADFGNDPAPFVLTLGGADYVLCKLELTGRATLQGAAGLRRFSNLKSNVSTRVFFASPEACGLSSGTAQVSVRDWSRVTNSGWCALCSYPDENANAPDHHLLPQFLMVGSNSRTTKAEFLIDGAWPHAATSTQQLMLYAPRTEITLDTLFSRENEGYFAGKRLDIVHGSEIEAPLNMDKVGFGIAEPDFTNYGSNQYVECGRPGATHPNPPDANC
jgi:hypothetical protein